MKLADLRSLAAQKLAGAHQDVVKYIDALESRVSASAGWIAAGAVIGAIIGYAIAKL